MNNQPTPISTPPLAPRSIQNINILKFLKKAVALSLIGLSLFHIYQSIKDILFVLPQIEFVTNPETSKNLYVSLIKKAILISTSLFIDTFYGFALLVKPTGATRTIHIVLGIILFILSNIIFQISAIDQILANIDLFPLT
ncbi:hypothetical protein ACFL18_02900 [Patescibacteria group bacterium]